MRKLYNYYTLINEGDMTTRQAEKNLLGFLLLLLLFLLFLYLLRFLLRAVQTIRVILYRVICRRFDLKAEGERKREITVTSQRF